MFRGEAVGPLSVQWITYPSDDGFPAVFLGKESEDIHLFTRKNVKISLQS